MKTLSGTTVQGSNLEPLIFLMCMNELTEILFQCKMKVKLFVDDVKVYAKIVNIVDSKELQSALDALAVWAEK